MITLNDETAAVHGYELVRTNIELYDSGIYIKALYMKNGITYLEGDMVEEEAFINIDFEGLFEV